MRLKILLALLLFFSGHISATVQPSLSQAKDYAAKVSWAFEENKGQVEGKDGTKVNYFYKQGNLTMFLMNGRLAYQFEQWHYPQDSMSESGRRGWKSYEEEYRAHEAYQKKIKRETYRMDIELLGANKNCEIFTEGKSHDYIQYYNHDALDVHAYQKITYKNIYPNIDWVVYLNANRQSNPLSSAEGRGEDNSLSSGEGRGEVKYDFIIHPGGDPSLIRLRTHWVEDLHIKPDGNLMLVSRMGSITENPPISFQEGKMIATQFQRYGNTISFHLENYDENQILVIDPSIAWSTYYGGANREHFNSCEVDKKGNVFTAGLTEGSTLITAGAHQTVYGGFISSLVVKFSSEGKRLWASYYGGNGDNWPFNWKIKAISLDSLGNLFLIGNTRSNSNITTSGSYNSTKTNGNGIHDACGFLVKFNSSGIRQWGTYYNRTHFRSIIVDNHNNILCVGRNTVDVNGNTSVTVGSVHMPVASDFWDGFIVKFNQSGFPIWSSFYGGSRRDEITDCAVDLNNNIFITGTTNSENNISHNGYKNTKSQNDYNFGLSGWPADTFNRDHFLVKLNSVGIRQWGTYFGDSNFINWQQNLGYCATDLSGNVYFTAYCYSFSALALTTSDFTNSYQNVTTGERALLAKFNSVGQIKWSRLCLDAQDTTLTMKFADESVMGCKFGFDNNIYIYGKIGSSSDLKVKPSGLSDTVFNYSIYDGFIQSYDTSGQPLFGTFYGGHGLDGILDVSFGNNKEIFFCGGTDSSCSLLVPQRVSTNMGIKGFQNNFGGSPSPCNAPAPAGDGFLTKICTQLDTPKIEISSNRGTSICGGGQVIYTATDTFEGDDPIYTWYKNGNPIGMDTNTLTMASIQDKDSFKCRLISSASCLFKDTAWSNTIVMKIKAADTYSFSHTKCKLRPYSFKNKNLDTSGLYRDTLMSSAGCDSFVFLHLIVKDTSLYEFTHVTPCDSVSYMFDGILITQPGKYTAKDTNALGCDSTTILNLFFRKPTHTRLPPVQICPDTSYVFDGIARKVADDYIKYYRNTDGCRSTDSLRLSILNTPSKVSNPIPACAPFTFRGKTYTSSATVVDTIKSRVGNCDSVIVNNLIQLKPPAITLPDTNFIVCDSIRLNNRLYTTSFSFIDTFRTLGTVCDSVYKKTNYTIRYTPQIGLKVRDTFIRSSQVTLRPNSATNYLWSTGETSRNVSFKLMEDRQLYLIAWNEEPCRDTAYISLVAEDLAIVGMPTGFSPTGEHLENRTLRPNINGRLERFHMMVFNRWGEKVYETFDTQPLGWNGIFKGEPAPSGLYGYVMEYRTLGIIYTRSGEVMLVR